MHICFKNSQSHHTGIEIKSLTYLQSPCICSQSHHTGIEIWTVNVLCILEADSQSHHTGIEILEPDFGEHLIDPLNRTILELK